MTLPEPSFSYRPAPLLGKVTFSLANGVLASHEEPGWELALADVTHAAFVQHRLGRTIMLRLDLSEGGTLRRLSYNGSSGGWRDVPDAHVFLDLAALVVRGLGIAQPGFTVTYGEYGRARTTMFAVGLASVLGGLGLFLAALATGVPAARLAAAAVPALLMLALGGTVAFAYAPWRKPRAVSAAALAPVLARHRGNA